MGRHSIPGPGESFGEPAEPADSVPRRRRRRYDSTAASRTWTPRPRAAASPGEGGHRSEGGRRGVSIGVIAALITVVVVVGGVILWRFFGDALSHRSTDAAQQCLAGTANVAVVADPSIADNVTTFAESFNADATPVGDRCVKVVVTPADSDAVINGFVTNWPADLGERPALWIPASSGVVGAAAGRPRARRSSATPAHWSPRRWCWRCGPQLKDALAQQGWAALPGLQTNPDGAGRAEPAGLGIAAAGAADRRRQRRHLSGRRGRRLGVGPAGRTGHRRAGCGQRPGGRPAQAGRQHRRRAWKALLGSGDPAAAPVHAVVTTEQQLFQRASSICRTPRTAVADWLPPGPVARRRLPHRPAGRGLAGRGAGQRGQRVRPVHAQARAAGANWPRPVSAPRAPPRRAMTWSSFAPLGAPLSVGDDSVRATLAAAVAAPADRRRPPRSCSNQAMTGDEGGSRGWPTW